MREPQPLSVALDLPLHAGDASFTFTTGQPLAQGTGVVVPFGRRLLPGIVLGEGTPRPDLRPVLAVVGTRPLVPRSTVELAAWVGGEYLSSIGEALAAAVPWDALWAGLRVGAITPWPPGLPGSVRAALEAMAHRPVSLSRAGRLLAHDPDALCLIAQANLLTALVSPEAPPASTATARADARPGMPSDRTAASSPAGRGPTASAWGRRLEAALGAALEGGPRTVVVAGWRRTEAYLAAVRRAHAAGWSAVLTFASAASADTFAAAARSAGLQPVLLHAELAPRMRLSAWRGLVAARGALVVGTRSAIFAPVEDPILAVVDDEDASGHKEERAPRYLTRVVAAERTRRAGILLVGSTTPTVETYAAVAAGKSALVAVPSPRPRIGVVDLRRRPADQPVSSPVLDALRRTVRRRGRAVVLTDRKGYAGGLQCGECGGVEACPRCGVPMPYDRQVRLLRCRVCGAAAKAPPVCSRCGAARLAAVGAGSERLAAVLRRITRAVTRLDRDALGPGRDPARVLAPFRERGGILVSTAVVLPWLESLRPDLVAVVAADRLLHRPEYRAAERAVAWLRAVAMAARTVVLVETARPAHPAIQAVRAPSLREFYDEDLALRVRLGYPPACTLVKVALTARTAEAADAAAAHLAAAAPAAIEVLGPLARPRAQPRADLVIKAFDRAAARAFLWPWLVGRGVPRGVRITADLDPHDL